MSTSGRGCWGWSGQLEEAAEGIGQAHLLRGAAIRREESGVGDDRGHAAGAGGRDVEAVQAVEELHPPRRFVGGRGGHRVDHDRRSCRVAGSSSSSRGGDRSPRRRSAGCPEKSRAARLRRIVGQLPRVGGGLQGCPAGRRPAGATVVCRERSLRVVTREAAIGDSTWVVARKIQGLGSAMRVGHAT